MAANLRGKHVAPTIGETAFNCPHCGALTTQYWYSLHAEPLGKDKVPRVVTRDEIEAFDWAKVEPAKRAEIRDWLEQMASGEPFVVRNGRTIDYDVYNFSLSRCFACDALAIWLVDRLIWPELSETTAPNLDLPNDVRADYDEASSILNRSPRGAAALLRLAVQKLCSYLGEKGKSIDEDIASLVRKGLDPRVQQALDVVRVVGNNAVHPGQIDLRDNVDTAQKLFGLVNLIAEIMITQPKHIREMYERLPDGAREAIAKRDSGP